MRIFVLAILLTAFWLLLSGYLKPLLLVFGVVSILGCLYFARVMRTDDEEGVPLQAIPGSFTYFPWLFWEIVKSSITVAQIVIHPKLPISPTLTRVRASQRSDVFLNVYANSITLTPGTITAAVEGRDLVVHALIRENADDIEAGGMDERVAQFEGSK